ncbi:nuclear-interacting partner of ALK-like [Carassius auratus]|uniref:Nuclear-interacting partner of ALK-like n=1 Tax=Carassius auratus TaxID=7957 RepID=A0A6P6JY17_CARAU|nr:nuclear-interacting partner of ALK-like [Carassius auratus]
MAAPGGWFNRSENGEKQSKSPLVSPLKVRELLNEGVASEDNVLNFSQQDPNTLSPDGLGKAPCEAANKEAFFNRVESYSCLKWAGKPRALSPLRCARYGWINVDCDMLKCSNCQAFLCASIQATLDFQKYEGRISELLQQLQTQHEKFCSWPDFPCPDRFWMVPVNEPTLLLCAFLDRFKSACLLEQQLPAMKPEQLKAMTLTEDVISVLLQLIEEEQVKQCGSPTKVSSDPLSVQVAACIVALCGWAASPSLQAMNLPILTCSYCMRKVGMWSFFQMETVSEIENPPQSPTSSTALTPSQGTSGEKGMPTSPSQSPTPCRMKLRSQDPTRSEQMESTPSSQVLHTRNRDSPIPHEEFPSPLSRGKRPMTRSRGPGENLAVDVPSSPQRKTKRPRLSSTCGSEGSMHRNVFDPVAQHRDWCPWVSVEREEANLEGSVCVGSEAELPQPGWKAALTLFLSMKRSLSPVGASPAQGPHDKSKRVFSIFRQWQVSYPSQLGKGQ